MFPAAFRLAFDEIRARHHHTVRIIPADTGWLKTFNCYAFALGIAAHPRYQLLVRLHSNGALANSDFVSAAFERGELSEIDAANAESGDLVFYFTEGAVAHAAIVVDDKGRLQSKWGPNELYEHGLWEVPEPYGDQVKFVAAPDPEHVIDLLDQHVDQQNRLVQGSGSDG